MPLRWRIFAPPAEKKLVHSDGSDFWIRPMRRADRNPSQKSHVSSWLLLNASHRHAPQRVEWYNGCSSELWEINLNYLADSIHPHGWCRIPPRSPSSQILTFELFTCNWLSNTSVQFSTPKLQLMCITCWQTIINGRRCCYSTSTPVVLTADKIMSRTHFPNPLDIFTKIFYSFCIAHKTFCSGF